MKSPIISICVVLVSILAGCNDPRDEFGKTFYLDGAGNWGFGVADVAAGLRSAGYRGRIENFIWTTSFNPALDQVNRPGAQLRALLLARRIDSYLDRYPENDVNIIALSAGTGVAIWAVEKLDAPHRVNNLVLLGSSLSHDYDIRKAAESIRGRIYVYSSPHDRILQGPVRALGTIDGKIGHDAAGLVGLRPIHGPTAKVVNVPWDRSFVQFGWTGAHTDCTSEPFVREVIAKHVVAPGNGAPELPAGPGRLASHRE